MIQKSSVTILINLLVIVLNSFAFLFHAQQSPEEILAHLSLRQKIGQLFVVAAASNFNQPIEKFASSMKASPYVMDLEYVESLIRDYGVGGVIFLYKSDPVTQLALTKLFQAAAHVPLFIMQDSEWGLSMRLDRDPTKVVRYPHNMTVGAIQDEKIIYEVAYEIGRQCAAIGVHMNLAPVVDINNNKYNPVIHDRSFGDDPARVARLAQIYAQGLQDGGVLACAKHFPGHGDTCIDSHLALPLLSHTRERLDTVELVPFRILIKSSIDGIMYGHLHVPALDAEYPVSLSYDVVTELVQKKWNYQGLNITDGLGMKAVMQRYEPGYLELRAFLAGNDILLCPVDVPHAVLLIEHAIKDGSVSEEDLNRRVLKVLCAKAEIFEKQAYMSKEIVDVHAFLTRQEAYDIQRKAYRGAITYVQQSEKNLLMSHIFDASYIVQIGELSENVFLQGCKKRNDAVMNYSSAFVHEEYKACVTAAEMYETIIIAVGQMNKSIGNNFGIGENVNKIVTYLQQQGKSVLVILFGTPYSAALFKDADGIIVAYEDVPVAQEAVVDVLCGELIPAGILPVRI